MSVQQYQVLLPGEEIVLTAMAEDLDIFDLYDPEWDIWLYDEICPDSVNWGETQAKHHKRWSIFSGGGSLPYGFYGEREDPHDYDACWERPFLVYRAGGPTEAGLVVLLLEVDDNNFEPPDDFDNEEDDLLRLRQSDDNPPLSMKVPICVMEVVNLTWEAYGDNLPLSGCQNIFPEKTTYSDTANYRNLVNLKISLPCPVAEGKSVEVKVKLFDVDDPNYSGSPVDPETPVAYNDNQCNDRTAAGSNIGACFGHWSQGGEWINEAGCDKSFTFNGGEQEKPVQVEIIDPRPGNNWNAVASTRTAWLNGVHLDTDGLTFKDGNDGPVDGQCISPMLTVWRTLHVEKDVMEGEDYPDLSLFQSAFAPAYIVIACDTDTDSWNCTFYSNFETAYEGGFVAGWKGTVSQDDYWAVSLCGAHDAPANHDNDPDTEQAWPGKSYDEQGFSVYNGSWRCTYSWTYNETIEDVCSEHTWDTGEMKEKNCLHETAHQFKLGRMHMTLAAGHNCIAAKEMTPDKPGSFCLDCRRDLMKEGRPGHH